MSVTENGIIYTPYQDGYSIKKSGDFSGESYVIPSSFNGKPILKIEGSGFFNVTITNLVLPNSLKVIDANGFNFCHMILDELVIHDSIVEIGSYAFSTNNINNHLPRMILYTPSVHIPNPYPNHSRSDYL